MLFKTENLEITAIVLNYNCKDTLSALLNSIYNQSTPPNELLLLDNHSQDGSQQILIDAENTHINTKYIAFPTNLGFAKAMNIGIQESQGKYVFILNSDLLLGVDYFKNCLAAFQTDEKIGFVTGAIYRLINGRQTDIVDSLGLTITKARLFHDIGVEKTGYLPKNQKTYVFGVSGCAPAFSKKMLRDICQNEKPFPEVFESYYEDVDLCWRGQLNGWKAFCAYDAQAWHVREGSLKSNSLKSIARDRCLRNRYWVMLLNENPWIWISHSPAWIWTEFLLGLRIFIKPGLIRAYISAVIGIPQILQLRKNRQKNISLKSETQLFSNSEGAYIRRVLKKFGIQLG